MCFVLTSASDGHHDCSHVVNQNSPAMRRILSEWKTVQAEGLAMGEGHGSVKGNSSDTFRLKVNLPLLFHHRAWGPISRDRSVRQASTCTNPDQAQRRFGTWRQVCENRGKMSIMMHSCPWDEPERSPRTFQPHVMLSPIMHHHIGVWVFQCIVHIIETTHSKSQVHGLFWRHLGGPGVKNYSHFSK